MEVHPFSDNILQEHQSPILRNNRHWLAQKILPTESAYCRNNIARDESLKEKDTPEELESKRQKSIFFAPTTECEQSNLPKAFYQNLKVNLPN